MHGRRGERVQKYVVQHDVQIGARKVFGAVHEALRDVCGVEPQVRTIGCKRLTGNGKRFDLGKRSV